MLTSERKALIKDVLKAEGRIVAKEFSRRLKVSEDTIRRDLRELAAEGLLLRVHGGALPASPAIASFGAREQASVAAKVRLAQAAVGLIAPDQVIFIDGGTTNVQLARHLPRELRATVVTHSPSIAVELVDYPQIAVELIGGRLFKHSIVAVGAACIEAVSEVRADLFFMGATGIHPEAGVTTGDREEAAIKRLIARQSAETVILATADKLGAASPYRIMPLAEVGTVIAERGLADDRRQPLLDAGVALLEA
jgi:DeoR/GlpR family transcriptional regulator of sugar metabolism